VDWPAAEPIETARLTLEPLRVDHAGEMREVLGDSALYDYTGGKPPSFEELRTRYAMQAVGRSPDGRHGWLNWIARDRDTGAAVGTVQATLTRSGGQLEAEIAWIIGVAYQRRGFATEAAGAMVEWLEAQGAKTIMAHIHPGHTASMGVARRLGMTATDVIEGGETRWEGPLARPHS
jgi:RimJ/RimL family protein N-acetyltransferase